jgi:hemerythrin-like domain-containing protein
MNGVERAYGQLAYEVSCLVCGSRRSKASVPFLVALAKLQKQHESILQQIRVSLKNLEVPNRGEKVEASWNLKIRYFARLTKLVAEHRREEERILFPIVDKYLDSSASETIRCEHTEILEALQKLNGKLLQVNGSDESRRRFFQSATEFEAMAREQFSREENVIYWFASLCLSQSDQPLKWLRT